MKLTFDPDFAENGFYVRNKKKEPLGEISYYDKWKCWVWEQAPNIIMSADCLKQVLDNIEMCDKTRAARIKFMKEKGLK